MNIPPGLTPEEDLRQERLYRQNRTSSNHFLNIPRNLPLVEPRLSSRPIGAPIGLQIFNTIHNAVARAERRLLINPQESRDDSRHINPVRMLAREIRNNRNSQLFPQQGAPVEFTCSICMTKISKGTSQQILRCGHKFCASCFNQWHQRQGGNTTCPTCRTPVYNSSMNQPPMASNAPAVGINMRASPVNLRGSQLLTPQEQALALLFRNNNI